MTWVIEMSNAIWDASNEQQKRVYVDPSRISINEIERRVRFELG